MSIRITHVVGEVLRAGDPSTRITHVVGEVLRAGCYWFVEDVQLKNYP